MDTYLRRSMLCLLFCVAFTDTARAAPRPPQAGTGGPSPVPLSFQQFFKMPVGPYGLQPSKQLLALNGRQVRISGYVVDEQEPTSGLLLLTPVPVSLAEREDGPADDLPGSTLFVHLESGDAADSLRRQPGPIEITGRLDLGGHEEPDGRISYVRLYVAYPPAARAAEADETTQSNPRETTR